MKPLQERALSVPYSFAPVSPSRGPRWLNRWWPSRRLGVDPLQGFSVEGRYAPVSIANWKLIPSVARDLIAGRVIRPLSFSAERRLTVIVPYRDRAEHLAQLLPALRLQLAEQSVRARVLVVEQQPGGLFNRGRLLNVGMHFAAESSDYYCLHDVDTVPITANYWCPSQPLRLVNTIVGGQGQAWHRACYYFSGAVSIRKEQAFAANGFSNEYWGWGKEDDDFFFRLLVARYLCYFDLQGTFADLPNPRHQQVERRALSRPPHVRQNRQRRSRLLRGLLDPAEDGLNTLRYEVLEHLEHAEYEKISVRW